MFSEVLESFRFFILFSRPEKIFKIVLVLESGNLYVQSLKDCKKKHS